MPKKLKGKKNHIIFITRKNILLSFQLKMKKTQTYCNKKTCYIKFMLMSV